MRRIMMWFVTVHALPPLPHSAQKTRGVLVDMLWKGAQWVYFCICRVEVTCKRFDCGHVGMCNPADSQPNHKLALALTKAAWQHALELAAADNAAKL